MVEYIGVLKVKVVKGTDLAIRDIRTSDPYVVVSLGQQVRIIYKFRASLPRFFYHHCDSNIEIFIGGNHLSRMLFFLSLRMTSQALVAAECAN